jgi:nucleoside-diphosphate-sugar epimerase
MKKSVNAMKIIVSGSRGFIGSAVKKELEFRGHHVMDGNESTGGGGALVPFQVVFGKRGERYKRAG